MYLGIAEPVNPTRGTKYYNSRAVSRVGLVPDSKFRRLVPSSSPASTTGGDWEGIPAHAMKEYTGV